MPRTAPHCSATSTCALGSLETTSQIGGWVAAGARGGGVTTSNGGVVVAVVVMRVWVEIEGMGVSWITSQTQTSLTHLYFFVFPPCLDRWERYVYLRGRDSLLVNSNYYGLGCSGFVPSTVQSARAAVLVWELLRLKQSIEHEELAPMVINSTVPLCMQQYVAPTHLHPSAPPSPSPFPAA